jgi:hypothetical protein
MPRIARRVLASPARALAVLAALAACAGPPATKLPPAATRPAVAQTSRSAPDQHVPAFAAVPFEVFSRADAVAIALREWRLFGQVVDDDPPGTRPQAPPEAMPERMPGLWQRVGEYWWEGMDPQRPESAWTGMHDENGTLFDAQRDSEFAWSAAFVSYVMRLAGAGPRFPYAPRHDMYIDAAVQGQSPVLRAYPITAYAPRPGDLICTGRGQSAKLKFADLPAKSFASHCDIVVAAAPGTLTVVGGNVDDAVAEKHVPIAPDGQLAGPNGKKLDSRYSWFVVLQVLYDR